MSLNRNEKEAVIAEVAAQAGKSQTLALAEYRGLTVAQLDQLRKTARAQGVYLHVLKNTLARRAVAGTQFEVAAESMSGPLIYGFSEDAVAAAKVIADFAKGNDKLVTKAVAIGGVLYGPADLDRLASLPTLDQARAILLGVLQAPATKLVRTLAEPPALVARVLAARAKAEVVA